ncbi:MAG: hypothetical protein JW762_14340 [Dehalococcoidales bacterium]|nr:hypothetical protein [Dehalococcoidales bacterium]
MKITGLKILIVILMISLVCMGMTSCHQDSVEEQDNVDDVNQMISEEDYNIEIIAIAVELTDVVNSIDQVLANKEITDPDLITAVNLAIEDITILSSEVCRIVPPDSMADTHSVNLESITNLDNAVGLLTQGIDSQDNNLVNQAITEMWLAVEVLSDITGTSE